MIRYLSVIVLLFLTSGCWNSDNGSELPVIDVVGALGTYRQVPMSEYISEIEYIPLETGTDCLVGRADHVIVTDTRIIVGGFDECHAFTRDGKFLSDVGMVGRGPGEWEHFFGMSVDEDNGLVYLETFHRMFEYTMDGKYVRDFPKPIVGKEERGNYPLPADNVVFLCDGMFLGYVGKEHGQELFSWIVFDDTGATVKEFKNHVKFDKEHFSAGVFNPAVMVSESTWVKESVNDTLFTVTMQDGLTPRFVFNRGRYAYPLDGYVTFENNGSRGEKSVSIYPTQVLDDNILFRMIVGENTGIHTPAGNKFILPNGVETDDGYMVFGLYNIQTGKTELFDRDPVTRRWGLVNDLDGGLPFWPKYYTSDGELVQVLSAFDIKSILTEEYFAAHPARDPAAHARLRELVRNLKEDDNPVIVIAKLK